MIPLPNGTLIIIVMVWIIFLGMSFTDDLRYWIPIVKQQYRKWKNE